MNSLKIEDNVLIVGNLSSHLSSKAFLNKYLKIFNTICHITYLISADNPNDEKIIWLKIDINPNGFILKRYYLYIKSQFLLILMLFKNRQKYEKVIFLTTSSLLPVIFLKFFKKKNAIFVAQKPNKITVCISQITFIFADLLLIESANLINEWNIEKYNSKVMIGSVYVDDTFKKMIDVDKRDNLIGFVGRFSVEKGILNFIESIPKILQYDNDIKFIIAGDGPLNEKVRTYLSENDLLGHAVLADWISSDDLPIYLNKLKLLVIPSTTEGLPNIILESFACATPILANPVGGIPDLVKDSETGFLMSNNSSEVIAQSVIRCINYPNLDKITKNAYKTILVHYKFEKAVERYSKIIQKLNK